MGLTGTPIQPQTPGAVLLRVRGKRRNGQHAAEEYGQPLPASCSVDLGRSRSGFQERPP
jgi:hypothetical protein